MQPCHVSRLPTVVSRGLARRPLRLVTRRSLTVSSARLKAYEYSNVFGDDFASQMNVNAVMPEGIAMQIGLLIPTPVILLNEQIFLWNVPPVAPADLTWRGFTTDAFKVFEVVAPKPELIVIGTGKSMVPLAPHLRHYLRDLGYQLEIQDTSRAAASLNMLAEEGRSVAGALLPLRPVHAVSGEPIGPVAPS